jgi:spore germination protein GerM
MHSIGKKGGKAMRKKILIILFILICLVGLGYMIIINTVFNKNEEIVNEYIPEVEISDNELRKTTVTLYFENIEENKLTTENRMIDSKTLLREPYTTLIGMLLEGAKDSKLENIISDGTKILSATLNGNCVTVDLSKEFVENAPDDVNRKCDMIYMIVNTLTELKEVESVKFLIEGESTNGFDEDSISLKNEYVRRD